MSTAQPIHLPDISHNFPRSVERLIDRPHIISTIDAIFGGQTTIVCLEGEEGIGKTTTCAQFARHHTEQCFSLFIQPHNRFAYSPEFLRSDLSDQIHWVLHRTRVPADANEEAVFRTSLLKLHQSAVRNRRVYYFSIDGLADLATVDPSAVAFITTELIPIGLPQFRFLFGGDLDILAPYFPKQLRGKPLTLSPFTIDETRALLASLTINPQTLTEIHHTTRGVPGHLASVVRILQSSQDPQALVSQLPSSLNDLFEVEWKALSDKPLLAWHLISIVAYARHTIVVSSAAEMLSVKEEDVQAILSQLSFLHLDKRSTAITFQSSSFQQFSQRKLAPRKSTTLEQIASYLIERQDSLESALNLPSYLEDLGRSEAILEYLTPEQLEHVCHRLQSLTPVRQTVEFGIRAAKKLNRLNELVRFALEKSVITELDTADVIESEVEAYLALENYDRALTLAQTALLKEDRLHLLSLIARRKCEANLTPEDALLQQIDQLYRHIDPTTLSNRAFDIAGNLFLYRTEAAVTLIESMVTGDDNHESLDFALAKLSFQALARDPKPQTDAARDTIVSKIRDPTLKTLTRDIALLVRDSKALDVIDRCEAINSTAEALFLLGHWASANSHRDDAWNAIDYGLKRAIRSTEYIPKTETIRNIVTPLPHCAKTSPERSREIADILDGLRVTLEKRGPTVEVVRIYLLVAGAEAAWNHQRARERLVELYLYCLNQEPYVRLDALAWVLRTLIYTDPNKEYEKTDGLHSLVERDFLVTLEDLLSRSFDHARAVDSAIRALAGPRTALTFQVIDKLNTTYRRDIASRSLIDNILMGPYTELDASSVGKALNCISDEPDRDLALLHVLRWLNEINAGQYTLPEQWIKVLTLSKSIADAGSRAEASALCQAITNTHFPQNHESLAVVFRTQIVNSLNIIDRSWERIDCGFRVSRILAASDPSEARGYLERASDERERTTLSSENIALAYMHCFKLASRAFIGMVPRSIRIDESLERLRRLIEQIPSNCDRACLWGDIAIRCFSLKAHDLAKRVVSMELRPVLDSIGDLVARNVTIRRVAAALYLTHPATAMEQLAQLPPYLRDRALYATGGVILSKLPESEPYDVSTGNGFDVSYEDCIDVLEVVSHIEGDFHIFGLLSGITESVTRGPSKNRLTKEQRAFIVTRMRQLASEKFPSRLGVQHRGYELVVLALAACIEKAGEAVWKELIEGAHKLPNIADKALVLCLISERIPAKYHDLRQATVESAHLEATKVSSPEDQVDRYTSIADAAVNFNLNLAKTYLETATRDIIKRDIQDTHGSRRSIIDLAHRIDPAFANTLISLYDDDPARKHTKRVKQMKNRLQALELRQSLTASGGEAFAMQDSSDSLFEAAWLHLGSLHAGRVTTMDTGRLAQYIEQAAHRRFSESYVMMSWIVENAVQRFMGTDQAAIYLFGMFQAACFACELSARIAARASGVQKRVTDYGGSLVETRSAVVVRPNERQIGLSFIGDWLRVTNSESIEICDPYFGPGDLDLLLLIARYRPKAEISILTSEKHHRALKIDGPLDEWYRERWRIDVADQRPPNTTVVVVGTASSGEFPVHDRWILGSDSGIRLGTSYGAIGRNRVSELSILDAVAAKELERVVQPFLTLSKREYNGERLKYQVFTL